MLIWPGSQVAVVASDKINVRRTLHTEAQSVLSSGALARLAARTMAGAHISDAAEPMKMLRRVIRLSWLEIGAVIDPFLNGEAGALCDVCRRNGPPAFADTTLPQRGRLAKAPALLLMNPSCRVGLGERGAYLGLARGFAPPITKPFPDFLAARNRGLPDIFFINSSCAASLPAVGSVVSKGGSVPTPRERAP